LSSEKLDYSGDNLDWDNVYSAADSSNFSHLDVEEGEITSAEG